ncbi:MAG TPA: hypothetical protein VFA20_08880 [Myxococcaceae bacterium]|nr:hypothetical protein [Myxococcaceae bacterium]
MKRVAPLSVLTLALLVATLARADWHPGNGLNGGPQDSWIADAGGYFSVHTTGTSAYRMLDNGTSVVTLASVPVSNARCTAIVNDKVEVGAFINYYHEGNPTPTPVPNQTDITECRVTENLAGIAYGDILTSGPSMFSSPTGTWPTPMNPVDVGDPVNASSGAISAHTIFGRDYGFIPRNPPAGGIFTLDGVHIQPFFTLSMSSVARSEIFGARDGGVRAIQVGGDGGQLLTLAAPSQVIAEGFGLPAALVTNPNPYRIKAVTLSELEGGPNGAGFGMLLVGDATAGTPNLWRAIPDPNNVGRYWVPTTVPPPALTSGIYDSVRCLNATFCVLGSSSATNSAQTQLATYRNRAAPGVEPPAFVVQEGASGVSMTVDAGDDDGDAIFVTWAPDAGASLYFSALAPDPASHDRRTWVGTSFPSPNSNLCGKVQAVLPVSVFAHDGLQQGPTADGTITIVHTLPGPLTMDQVSLAPAGPSAVTQRYTFVTNGCSGLGAEVLPSGAATAAVTPPNTLDVTFTPPRVWCDDTPDSGARTFQVRVVDGLVKSLPANATFVVLPWGQPEPPFGTGGRTAFQDAGTTVTYSPDATHLCEGDAGNFPGVDTFWTWAPSAGFTPIVLQADGGALPQSGATTPTATVTALDCQSGSITFQATNTTKNGGLPGMSSPLTVNVTSTPLPLSGAVTVSAAADGGSVFGVVDLTPPVQCPQNRAGLGASVELHRASDGGLISSGTVPGVPASYSLQAPGACGGGAFYVRATVSDSTGSVGPQDQPVTLPTLNPDFASVDVDSFKISCGDVARADASVTFGPKDCDSAQVDWSSAGAVAIAPGAVGPSVMLATVSNDFNGLIGLPVYVVATSTAESGVKSVPAAPVVVTVDPFVTVVHRTDTSVASESRVLGIEVQLKNQTTCDVTGVELHETLSGMNLVPGSVIGPDGGTIDPVTDAGELVIPGLSLPGGGQVVTVRYSARPALFGAPSPGGVAKLRDVPISEPSELGSGGSTCGCQSASGGAAALIGLAGAALLRRRRRVRARS